MSRSRRVVLTGIGVVCPLGLTLGTFRQALRDGRSGVRAVRAFDTSALPVRIAGEVEGFDAKEYLEKKDRKSLKIMARTMQLAVAAARLAADDGGLSPGKVEPERLGVDLGIGAIPGDLAE